MDEIFYLGIDPDTRNVSIALLDDMYDCKVVFLKAPTKLKGIQLVEYWASHLADRLEPLVRNFTGISVIAVVELQTASYTAKIGASPNDLLALANVGGMVAAVGLSKFCVKHCKFATVPEWKGSIPKSVNQCRTLGKMGLEYQTKGGKEPYAVPLDYQKKIEIYTDSKVNDSDWCDIMDSIGLAVYAKDKLKEELNIKGLL